MAQYSSYNTRTDYCSACHEMRSMNNITHKVSLFLCIVLVLFSLHSHASDNYSLVINHGRVINPETKLDAIRHIGISNGSIVNISTTPLQGDNVINAKGLVVSPGFIDLHSHSPTELGQHYQLFDGVTTALELEIGAHPVEKYASSISDSSLINYGASSSYLFIRLREQNGIALTDVSGFPLPINLDGVVTAIKVVTSGFTEAVKRSFSETANTEQLAAIKLQLLTDIEKGSLGIGLALDYISDAVNAEEIRQIFDVAAEKNMTIFVHVRRGINGDPSGLREVIDLATATGASVHICHLSHNAMRNTDLFLAEIKQAQLAGVDITTEVLPFNAGSSGISAAVFSRDWQTIFDINYEDVQWADSGEFLTKESWEHYREKEPQGTVIHHYVKEEWTKRAVIEPGVIIVSDLLPMKSLDKKVAPNHGAFTKILAQYVREEKLLSLSEAIEKMTLLPAQRLEKFAPAFKLKGRINVGADADLTLFNPNTVQNNATYLAPYQEASGIEHIIVNGEHLVNAGQLIKGVYPGKRITSKH